MENRRRVTEEDLRITEALIAQSYSQLKQSVIQTPTRACKSIGQTARQHPYATAGVAIVTGIALYGIFKMVTSHDSSRGARGESRSSMKKDTGRPDILQEMLPLILPLVAPYIGSFIQGYLGKLHSGEHG
jgi:hypothetical protein